MEHISPVQTSAVINILCSKGYSPNDPILIFERESNGNFYHVSNFCYAFSWQCQLTEESRGWEAWSPAPILMSFCDPSPQFPHFPHERTIQIKQTATSQIRRKAQKDTQVIPHL